MGALTFVQQSQGGQVPIVVMLEEEHLLICDQHLYMFSGKLDRGDGSLVGPCCFEEGAFVLGEGGVLIGELLTDDSSHRGFEGGCGTQIRLGLELLEQRHVCEFALCMCFPDGGRAC